MLVEYKPFEPAFYATDMADWGMAYLYSKKAGPRAKVLVDTGHHYNAVNIEQIVAWLLDEDMLGGFHFNDRKYADDDLTLGSIDPYQIFRIFHEIHFFASDRGRMPKIAYMIDQCHNEKAKVEAMIQTVVMAQELYTKASLVDHDALRAAQAKNSVIDAELLLKKAFFTDVSPALARWRKANQLPADPLAEHRRSGYERKSRRRPATSAARPGHHARRQLRVVGRFHFARLNQSRVGLDRWFAQLRLNPCNPHLAANPWTGSLRRAGPEDSPYLEPEKFRPPDHRVKPRWAGIA